MIGVSRIGKVVGLAAVAAVLMTGLTSCSQSVPKADVETTIETELGELIPGIGEVTCPGDLDAEVGKSVRCEFVVAEQPVDAVATVTSVEGSRANFDVKTEARPIGKALLEKKVGELIGADAGVAIDSATCAGDLQPQVGQTQSCTLVGGGETADFTVSVTGVEGGLVSFNVGPASA